MGLGTAPLSRVGAEELDGPDDEVDGGDDGEDDEPEPEDDVDLLVEDVHAEDAERVELLDRARSSVFVEDALKTFSERVGIYSTG